MMGLGLIIGLLARGSLRGLKDIQLKMVWVLFVSLAIAILPLLNDSLNKHRRVLLLVANAGVLLFLIVNILTSRGETRAGFLVIAVGWALNFIVIAANGGMPLSRWAYEASGQKQRITQGSGGFYRIVLAGPKTVLSPLGDVIPIRLFREVVSIGDIVLFLGVALVIASAMRTTRRDSPVEQPAQ
jgi:hypothetical protein